MKRFLKGLLALSASAALSVAVAAPAMASGGEADAAAQQCSAVADEHRSVWASPGTADGTVGSVVAGSGYTAECATVTGESYTACGATTNQWAYVNFADDRWGYVPGACLSWES